MCHATNNRHPIDLKFCLYRLVILCQRLRFVLAIFVSAHRRQCKLCLGTCGLLLMMSRRSVALLQMLACLCVHWLHARAVQKRQNGSRCRGLGKQALDGANVGATWRIQWSTVCGGGGGGDANCRCHCCSNFSAPPAFSSRERACASVCAVWRTQSLRRRRGPTYCRWQ